MSDQKQLMSNDYMEIWNSDVMVNSIFMHFTCMIVCYFRSEFGKIGNFCCEINREIMTMNKSLLLTLNDFALMKLTVSASILQIVLAV